MGEVYRARDGKLGRDVAIKVLPEAFAADAERLARFRREAQVLASLNHPHIAAIYGLAEADGVEGLVLELVEGETLGERIARGPLPFEEALQIARQIADALEAAHERGIVHRDLKPANVKLTPDGNVKVLDFGLAKALTGDRSSPDASHSPTLTAASTSAGMVIGTAAYMSPEQARGRPVDKRADIWAFGAILFEMLTGRRLFEGETVSDVLAGVLRQEIDFESVPAETPSAIVRLLHRTLERDPKSRLHDIADARLEIEESLRTPRRSAETAAPPKRVRTPGWLPWSIAAAALLIGAALARRTQPPKDELVHLSVPLPDTMSLDPNLLEQTQILAISPDGRRIAFLARKEESRSLFVRDLSRERAEPVAGTENGSEPFFSPDGEWLGFVAGGRLQKTSLRGGTPISLAIAPGSRGAAWGAGGSIVFAPTVSSPLFRIPDAGGEPRPLTVLDTASRERTHRWPDVISEGNWVLFTVGTEDKPGDYDESRIDAVSLETGKRHVVYRGASLARFAPPDHLLLARHGDVLAARFDAKTAQVRGAAVPVLQGVSGEGRSGISFFSAARNNALLYAVGLSLQGTNEIVWMDRTGRSAPTGIPPGLYTALALSPDGQKLTYATGPGGGARSDVWIADLANSSQFQLTSSGQAVAPCWTPDGASVVFSSATGDAVMRQRADGGAAAELLWRSPYGVPIAPNSFSADGSELTVTLSGRSGSRADLFLISLSGERKVRPLIATSAAEYRGMISPNGRWIAYTGEYEGGPQVYVQPYPGLAGRWQISTTGGAGPRWSHDGKELFFVSKNEMMAVPIREAPTFSPGQPRSLFKIDRPAASEWSDIYDVSPDGKRFVVLTGQKAATTPRLDVILNFGRQIGIAGH